MKLHFSVTIFAAIVALTACSAPQHYSIPCDSGSTSFSLAKRWHLSKDSPKRYKPKSITYEFTPDGPRYVPSLYVTVISRPNPSQDSYAEQHSLAEKTLKESRSTNWKNAGISVADSYTRKDSVEILKWVESSNGISLIVYIPGPRCITEIHYSGHLKNLAMYENDIDALIESIPLK